MMSLQDCVMYTEMLARKGCVTGHQCFFIFFIIDIKRSNNRSGYYLPLVFVLRAWGIWCNRNNSLFRGEGCHPMEIVRKAVSLHDECFGLNRVRGRGGMLSPKERWKPPPDGVVKINVDGGVFQNFGYSGVGIVIRDSRCAFLAAKAIRLDRAREVNQVEALALLAGLDFAKERGFTKIILEGDSESVLDKILDQSNSLATVEVILEDIRVLACDFEVCSFSHVKRDGNEIAHTLIREAQSVSPLVWVDCAPTSIASMLASEAA